MFEVGGQYANRKGSYTVLDKGADKMTVRYEDGTEAELRIGIQERIWENIKADVESSNSTRQRRSAAPTVQHFIKAVGAITDENLTPTIIRALATPSSRQAPPINIGDRFIYYSIKSKAFFAVATVTDEPQEMDAKNFVELEFEENRVNVFPIDIDAFAVNHQQAVWLDSVELESQPKFKTMLDDPETYLPISEDDFELLAEALTEYVEDSVELEDEDDLDDEDDELDDDLDDDLDI